MKRKWVIVSILVLVSVFAYIGFFITGTDRVGKGSGDTPKESLRNPSNTNIVVTVEPPDTVYRIYPESSRLILGSGDAIVRIILFADFSDEKTLEAVRIFRDIILQNNDISLYLYSFPVYKNELAIPLSNLFILSINGGKKNEFIQFVVNSKTIDKPTALDFAEKNGIDSKLVFEKYGEGDLAKLPALGDMNLGVNFGVNVPPVFFVNGVRFDKFGTKEEISGIIETHLKKAGTLLRAGIKKGDVYNELVKNGKDVAYSLKIKDRTDNPDAAQKKSDNIYEEDLRFVPLKGPRYAPVTIVLFADYECPYTKRFYTALNTVVKKYEKEVRLFVKHYPLSSHKRSDNVAKLLASALVQKKFWVLFDKIMEEPDFADEERIFEIASALGIDTEQLRQMKDSEKIQKYTENDKEKGSELGIRVLPTVYINGVKYEGVISASILEKIIENEKKLAEKLISEGVDEKDLYDNIVSRNKLKNFLDKGIKKPYIEKIK